MTGTSMSFRRGKNGAKSAAVDRGDDEHFGAAQQHVLNLRNLGCYFVVGILKVNFKTGSFQFFPSCYAPS